MKCVKCNAEIEVGNAFCPECGAKIEQKKKKKPLWLLFIIIPLCLIFLGAVLLGILGIGGAGIGLLIFGDRLIDLPPVFGQDGDSSVIQTDEKEEALTPVGAEEEASRLGKRQIPGSTAFVPGTAGLILAGEVVKDLIAKK